MQAIDGSTIQNIVAALRTVMQSREESATITTSLALFFTSVVQISWRMHCKGST